MRRNIVWASVTMMAVSAAPALAQEHTSLTDKQIQAQVEYRLDKKDINRVAVGVADGTVSLNGTVPNAWAKREAVEQALKVKSVIGVANNLAVTRAESDDALAEQIARKVRNYVSYTIFDDIQIGVDQGVATLSGRVTMPKQGERPGRSPRARRAGSLQRSAGVSLVTDDRPLKAGAADLSRLLFATYAFHANPPIHTWSAAT